MKIIAEIEVDTPCENMVDAIDFLIANFYESKALIVIKSLQFIVEDGKGVKLERTGQSNQAR